MADDKTALFLPSFRVDETLDAIRACLERGWTGMGFRTVEIEEAWRAYTGLPHAFFTNSATAALHTAVALFKRRHRWADGDEVISTPLTFVSTNHAILYERLRVRFADVDASGCLDPDDIEARIGPRTRAVMFVGLGGNSGQLPRIADLCRARGLVLILDATHMAGTRTRGQDPGHFADAACYSFHAVKNLPTFDAGMLCLHDATLDAEARKFGWMGISEDTYTRARLGGYRWQYDVTMVGHKYHGNSIAAAMALVGLKYLDDDNAYRRLLADEYDRALLGHPTVRALAPAADCVSSRLLYQVAVAGRDAVIAHLCDAGIDAGVHYRDNTEYPMYASGRGTCPRAARCSAELLSLPLHLQLTVQDVRRVAGRLLDVTVPHPQGA